MFLLLLFLSLFFATSIRAQANINVILSFQSTPCIVNTFCEVKWEMMDGNPDEKKFFIVKQRRGPSKFGDPQEINLNNGSGRQTTGVVLIKFDNVDTYNLVAFDKRHDKHPIFPPEEECGRLDNIQILAQPSLLPNSGAGPDVAAESSALNPSPTASIGNSGAVENDIAGSTEKGAKRTAVIVGSVLAGAIGLCLIVILIWLFVIRPRRRKQDYASNLSIFFNSRKSASTHAESGFGVGSPYAWPSPSEKSSGMVDNGHSPNPSTCDSITPLKSPRSHSAGSVSTPKTFSFPSIFTEATPPVRFAPLTDRQMDLQERVHNLKSQLIATREDSDEFEGLMKRIDLLERLHKSDWALEKTDDIPPGLFE